MNEITACAYQVPYFL